MSRSYDDDYDDDFPNIGSTGSLHDLSFEPKPGRLAGLGSVAQQDIAVVGRSRAQRRHPIGFRIPRARK